MLRDQLKLLKGSQCLNPTIIDLCFFMSFWVINMTKVFSVTNHNLGLCCTNSPSMCLFHVSYKCHKFYYSVFITNYAGCQKPKDIYFFKWQKYGSMNVHQPRLRNPRWPLLISTVVKAVVFTFTVISPSVIKCALHIVLSITVCLCFTTVLCVKCCVMRYCEVFLLNKQCYRLGISGVTSFWGPSSEM